MAHDAATSKASRKDSRSSFFSFAPSTRILGEVCQRFAISLESGIDIRRVVRSESQRTRGRLAEALIEAADAVEAGESFADSIAAREDCFGALFIEMARVGETTGSTAEIFRRLSGHYEHRAKLQRQFVSSLVWPGLQLAAALGVIGVLILVGGVLSDGKGGGVDILGFGLTGSKGLAVYINVLLGLAILCMLGVVALRRNPSLSKQLHQILGRAPIIGPCLDKIALARIAWTLHLTMNVELDMRRVARLALGSSGSPQYSAHADLAASLVDKGEPLSAAFIAAGVFPTEFIDSLVVAEETGQISESMARLSTRYEEEANRATSALAVAIGVAVWVLVAALLIMLIFRVFGFYVGVLNDAANI